MGAVASLQVGTWLAAEALAVGTGNAVGTDRRAAERSAASYILGIAYVAFGARGATGAYSAVSWAGQAGRPS